MPAKLRRWTSRHLALVRLHRGPGAALPLPLAEVARLCGPGWTARHAAALARHAGRCERRPGPWRPAEDDALRRLHARGLHDGPIALELDRSRGVVRTHRLALGLPAHGNFQPPGQPGRRSLAARRAAARTGWGGHALTPAEARLLSALEGQAGWKTGAELAPPLGLRWCQSPGGLCGRLRRLAARGVLLCRFRGRGAGGGKGGSEKEFKLAPGVVRQRGEAS